MQRFSGITGYHLGAIFATLTVAYLLEQYVLKTGSGAHSPSYRMGTGGSFHGAKAAKAWNRSLVSN
jgi:hypothetical protein